MLDDNYFEKREKRLEALSLHNLEEARNQRLEAQKTERLRREQDQQEKAMRQKKEQQSLARMLALGGVPLSDVWDQQMARLCVDFLEFAHDRKIQEHVLPLATVLQGGRRREVTKKLGFIPIASAVRYDGDTVSGYPIAYSTPPEMPAPVTKATRDKPRNWLQPGPQYESDLSLEDVYLCSNGLLRTRELFLPLSQGQIKAPIVGSIHVIEQDRIQETDPDLSRGSYMGAPYIRTTSFEFRQGGIDSLTTKLESLADRIQEEA